jgi:hypothetical protein
MLVIPCALKRNYFRLILPTVMLLTGLLMACQSETYLTDISNKLEFSQDSLRFDTLFSETGSTTAWITLRNKSSQPMRIQTVRLRNNGTDGFRLNLDGEPGTRFEQVEIPAHDSMFLFVSVTVPRLGSFEPVLLSDAVVFETENSTKQIALDAWAWDVETLSGRVFNSDTTLTADRPYRIFDSLVVASNATLTLQPGVKLFFHDKSILRVYGRILAQGTLEEPVQFRGDRLDKVIPRFPYDFYPGQWGYIHLTSQSSGNEFEYADIHGAYYGIVADTSEQVSLKATLRNSRIHNMIYTCLWSNGAKLDLANCQLTNSGDYTVALVGGNARFVHCTLANYQWLVTRDGPTLALVNFLSDETDETKLYGYPLSAHFLNCIVAGNQESEILTGKSNTYSWDVQFERSLLKSDTLTAAQALVKFCSYDTDPHFKSLGSIAEHYLCDFRIDSLSPAKDAGSVSTLSTYPFDLNGVSRITDGKPDMGAFEWKPLQP